MKLAFRITIETAYEKNKEILRMQFDQLMDAMGEKNIPKSLKMDMLRRMNDSAFMFVDSVLHVNKYTQNDRMIRRIQALHLEDAMQLHEQVFELFYVHAKEMNWPRPEYLA